MSAKPSKFDIRAVERAIHLLPKKRKRREDLPLPALISLGAELSVVLLRLEQSFNDRTINRRHSDPVAFVGCFWCLPVLDELVASSVIPQGGCPCIRKIPHWVFGPPEQPSSATWTV